MEDQQPAEGDLTGKASDDAPAAEAGVGAADADAGHREPEASDAEAQVQDLTEGDKTGHVPTGSAEGEDGEESVDTAQTADSDGEEQGDADGVANTDTAADGGNAVRVRRLAGRRLIVAVGAATALFVGSAAFAGAMVQPYLADRAMAATKVEVVRTAVDAITALWTYTPENMATLPDRAAEYLSGDFEAQYRKYIDAIAAPNKQAQVTNSTQVTGAGVESLDGPNATAIVYTNTTSTSPVTKDIPSLRYLSYRLFMRREHARWLVNRMTTITSLDLTPQL